LKFRALAISFAAGLLATLASHGVAIQAQQSAATRPAISDTTIPSSVLSQPTELLQMSGTPEKPLVLQVGSHVLYAEAHIPGSEQKHS
jgi:thiosulfate/3-mercaptopyruvate sulfurtransferase